VVSFLDEGNGRMYDFAELLGIPEMKEVFTGAFGEGNLDGKGESLMWRRGSSTIVSSAGSSSWMMVYD
jgi:hypothetical protein